MRRVLVLYGFLGGEVRKTPYTPEMIALVPQTMDFLHQHKPIAQVAVMYRSGLIYDAVDDWCLDNGAGLIGESPNIRGHRGESMALAVQQLIYKHGINMCLRFVSYSHADRDKRALMMEKGRRGQDRVASLICAKEGIPTFVASQDLRHGPIEWSLLRSSATPLVVDMATA